MLKILLFSYRRYFFASLLVHAVFLAFLMLSLGGTTPTAHQVEGDPKSTSPEIVQAVAIDEEKVATEVKRLQAVEQQQSKEREKEREKETAKLEQLKRDMAKAKAEAEAKLAEIKIAKDKEKKQLEDLKKAKEKEKKDLEALDEERRVEKERLKQLEAKKKAEETSEAAKKTLALKVAEEAKRQAGEKKAAAESKAGGIARAWGQDIRQYRREFENLPAETKCTLRVKLLADGNADIRIEKSSGNLVYDEDCVRAAYKNKPFPTSSDPLVMEELKNFKVDVINRE